MSQLRLPAINHQFFLKLKKTTDLKMLNFTSWYLNTLNVLIIHYHIHTQNYSLFINIVI